MQPAKHGPNRLGSYLDTHRTVMAKLARGGFVCGDDLELKPAAGQLRIVGRISCLGKIVIDVNKTLEIVGRSAGDILVHTVKYAYNVFVQGHGNLLRYDNIHTSPGHQDEHHRHEFDWTTGEECPGSPQWIGAAGWPTLGEVVEEVEAWYWKNRDLLDDPDKPAIVERRGRR